MRTISRRRAWSRKGQSIVEFAFAFPFLLLLIANTVNFAGLFYAGITVANAARHGSQYWVLAGASVGAPAPPDAALIYDLVTRDTLPLLNPSSLSIRACREDPADPTTPICSVAGSGTFVNPAFDVRDESDLFVMAWVDVEYEYQPYIPLFELMGVPLTPPPQTVRRQSVMRMLQ